MRKDIQGLRAIAVVSVLLFHFWPNRLPGGYVGVDIFFVISGFLITSHLLRKPPINRKVLIDFWAKRVRRLLPAATLVLMLTIAASMIWLPETMIDSDDKPVPKSNKKKQTTIFRQIPALAAVCYTISYILLVYRNNIFHIPPGELLWPMILGLAVVYGVYGILILIIKNSVVTELVTFALTVFLVHFGFVFNKFYGLVKSTISANDALLAVIFLILGFGLVAWLGLKARAHEKVINGMIQFLNTSLSVFLLVTIVTIGFTYVSNWPIFSFDSPQVIATSETSKSELPDIYYFVFDRYANNETLKKYYDFDNQEFIDELKSRGFILNGIEYANYPHTAASLASTFNMDYLDKFTGGLPPEYSESMYGEMINDASAFRLLKETGYHLHWTGSWWGPTRTNVQADVVHDGIFRADLLGFNPVVSNFQEQLMSQHVLGRALAADVPLASRLLHYNQPSQREIVEFEFGTVGEVVESAKNEDVFGLWHFLSPHPQYVFDADGSIPGYHQDANYGDVPEKVKYVNQMKFVNSQILKMLDYIEANSETKPIIILQPDEGPYLFDLDDSHQRLTESEKVKWKSGVLSAFKFPDKSPSDELSISPVNIFRYVMNEYLGYEFELLEHKAYNYSKSDPYNFKDVTELVSGD